MSRYLFLTAVAILMLFTVTRAQEPVPLHPPSQSQPRTSDILTLGLGYGLDNGGIGANLTVYPQENIGIFFGIGFAFAGFGYNGGLKIRALPNHSRSRIRPFIEGMYGYNAAVYVVNAPSDNKLFYGPTLGGGVDIGRTTVGRGYLSIAILVPFRPPEAQNYIDQLRNNGVTFSNSLPPIAISIAYKFILN